MCPRTALRRQLEHLWPERGDDPAAGRHLRGIEHVKVFDQYVIGLAVLLGVLRMADADAEQEAARICVFDPVIGLSDLFGRRRPDVDDAGGDLKRLRALEDRLDVVQVAGG